MNRAQRRLAQKQDRRPDAFAQALRLHQAGRLDAAEAGYRQVLAADPRHAASLHWLGVIAHQRGEHGAAAALIGRAIGIDARVALYHSNLGTALQALGRHDQAVACLTQAVALNPAAPELHYNLGNACAAAGRPGEAEASFRAALALRPDFAEAHCNLGNLLRDQGTPEAAGACYRAALAARPDLAPAHTNLGGVLARLGRLEEALACHRAAVALCPLDAASHGSLGAALADLGRLEEAGACLATALRLRPDDAASHFNLATVTLARGDLAAGWREYEWRWRTPQLRDAARDFPRPHWRGEAAAGRTLLIHAEQGYGDTLQFCRYAPLAAARGLRVILEVQPALMRLLAGLPGVAAVLARGESLPPFDLHCPMLSLPLAFATTLDSIPAAAAYLRAEAPRAARWAGRLAALETGSPLRVGLAWAGNPALPADRRRSLDPALLAPLRAVPSVHLISLQKDAPPCPGLTDPMGEVSDFADTAALIANLDLVIAADTAVAHLAGALGRQVWLLNRSDTCWRWLTGRRDSPWYPSLRLYRQPGPGEWEPVMAEVAADLRRLCAAGGRR
jgi:tetratricopeptide (TPR) repeat protein